MKIACRWLGIALLFWLSFTPPLLAHSPSFGKIESLDLPDFGKVQFAPLYGDGIFFFDPVQVVAFDKDGYLLAATPVLENLVIHCNRSGGSPGCIVYDELAGEIYEPDFERWSRGRIISEGGKPPGDAYPEYMKLEYGFIKRSATAREQISFELTSIARAPKDTAIAVLWWAVAWSFLTYLFWRWKRNSWQLRPIRWQVVLLLCVNFAVFAVMGLVAIWAWLIHPVSPYYFLLVSFLGGGIALLVMGMRRPRREPETG
jgi:hypothetical protein